MTSNDRQSTDIIKEFLKSWNVLILHSDFLYIALYEQSDHIVQKLYLLLKGILILDPSTSTR